jgi:uncharacterized protein YabN with tetrapyrrole methylase and pyrophosphatase domain
MLEMAKDRKRGSLTVVGTGIAVGQMTAEARAYFEGADKVLYCVADAATERLIQRINPNAESLYVFYDDDKRRSITYAQMVQRTLDCLREGSEVCMVFYGHPGIFVYPSHEAIKRAREDGFEAKMLPAVSSLDCLFADLGIDPATGCQMLEATDFLLRGRLIDTATHVIMWQVGCVGDLGFKFKGFDGRNIPILAEALSDVYSGEYEGIVYEAAQYNICEAVTRRTKLKDLATAGLTGISSLYLPPKKKLAVNLTMARRLGLHKIIKDKMVMYDRELVEGLPV